MKHQAIHTILTIFCIGVDANDPDRLKRSLLNTDESIFHQADSITGEEFKDHLRGIAKLYRRKRDGLADRDDNLGDTVDLFDID